MKDWGFLTTDVVKGHVLGSVGDEHFLGGSFVQQEIKIRALAREGAAQGK